MFFFTMDSYRFSFSEPFLSHRRKLFSEFSLCVGASLLLCSLFFFSNSLKVPKNSVFLSVFNSSNINSSFVSHPFSFDSTNHSCLSQNNASEEGSVVFGGTLGDMKKNSSFMSSNVTNGDSYNGNTSVVEVRNEGDFVRDKNVSLITHSDDDQMENIEVGFLDEKCDVFDGKWIRDYSKPYYPLGSCPFIDRDFNCHLNGRIDLEYVKWKWKPNKCHIPSLNATDFLERLRGQRLVFVGDSLNRNMWESLVCILRQNVRNKKRVFEISGKREFKKKGVYAFRFEDYNCSVDFVASPFLVRESSFKGKNGSFETLRLDLMDHTTTRYQDANILVFNTGHWWTHDKTSKGEDYYQEGNRVHPRLKALDAYTRALTTWAKWVDRKINANETQVFFRGYSFTHFWGGQWNSGGQCHKETEPIYNETYLQKYPSKMRAVEYVIEKMKTEVVYMNISRLTDYRKDGHPSVYRKDYKTTMTKNPSSLYEDCSHWCLPGIPDTWNELLYVSLLKYGKGTWKV
ncbi:protein trichome birefringence-like 2 isoform X2 [Lathyrus oleraceus]|uniref:Transducin beta-like protein 2 n=2 Tax=Pisum sativum TaxID=3888 RepID=A0A9D4XHB5_PEA|nr:protein trichome birefringence-like 2 isoform X2 [Pisum sativum]KAI5419175.1 Transducin beta-like protein 2 [Pisum sativum]